MPQTNNIPCSVRRPIGSIPKFCVNRTWHIHGFRMAVQTIRTIWNICCVTRCQVRIGITLEFDLCSSRIHKCPGCTGSRNILDNRRRRNLALGVVLTVAPALIFTPIKWRGTVRESRRATVTTLRNRIPPSVRRACFTKAGFRPDMIRFFAFPFCIKMHIPGCSRRYSARCRTILGQCRIVTPSNKYTVQPCHNTVYGKWQIINTVCVWMIPSPPRCGTIIMIYYIIFDRIPPLCYKRHIRVIRPIFNHLTRVIVNICIRFFPSCKCKTGIRTTNRCVIQHGIFFIKVRIGRFIIYFGCIVTAFIFNILWTVRHGCNVEFGDIFPLNLAKVIRDFRTPAPGFVRYLRHIRHCAICPRTTEFPKSMRSPGWVLTRTVTIGGQPLANQCGNLVLCIIGYCYFAGCATGATTDIDCFCYQFIIGQEQQIGRASQKECAVPINRKRTGITRCTGHRRRHIMII